MKSYLPYFLFMLASSDCMSQSILARPNEKNSFAIASSTGVAPILTDSSDFSLVKKTVDLLRGDIKLITGKNTAVIHSLPQQEDHLIIIASQQSPLIKSMTASKILNLDNIRDKWEAYRVQVIRNPFKGIKQALVIVGSDRRGTAYGVLEISRQLGVSPWYWWADVPVIKKATLYLREDLRLNDAAKVKYRGIFINDEAPALSNWSKEKFGGFNHLFYEKVFELMLRLKANYIWPAMWGNAFYDDDTLNKKIADDYGIVIGTSHHEPLMRAHDEWRRYGKGKWNYDSNALHLREFWKEGMRRATNEKIVSIGMRGDGDEPMTRETATDLLERIVMDQRGIIEEITGKPASQTPQLWALYKEVQDYYDKGMRVPDDVTLLLCDDNWGNIRKLPRLDEQSRKGGYGIYYHFDYVGGPRNYKWLNTNPLPRIWEQMHLAWQYKAREIWIVNVGDIKPMELPISFFLDFAWNPEKIRADGLQKYTEQWAAAQFGNQYAKQIADITSTYLKYNGRRKPELLDQNTFSLLNYNEFETVVNKYKILLEKAENINNMLPPEYRDAYFQLVLHPVKAMANLYEMYLNVALNNHYYKTVRNYLVKTFADKAFELYRKDSLITLEYHQLKNGKWNHMMSQTHIGYTHWQQPAIQKMPVVEYLPEDSIQNVDEDSVNPVFKTSINVIPKNIKGNIFYEKQTFGVSIEADHFTKAINSNGITWKILPDHGRTGAAVTPFPVTATVQKPGNNSPHLQYEFYSYSKDSFSIQAYFSPTLNFHNTENGLQYAISVDNQVPQVISINGEDKNTGRGIWNKWVSENIIIKTSHHRILNPGKHTVKYWMVNPGAVLQKLVLDFGDLKPSYLGPPETRILTGLQQEKGEQMSIVK